METQGASRATTLENPAATAALAAQLAGLARVGDVLALWGDLGMGKTAFARAFIAARAGEALVVPSPTFTLLQTYDLPNGPVWHFDLYRLASPDDVWELGWEQGLSEAILLVEWPQRLGDFLPADRLDVSFAQGDGPEQRLVRLAASGAWEKRLDACHV
jgi:tRNA threonylcarbamoyladenosine biosynthesis protein TsaE